MCAACKLLLNRDAVIGSLNGIGNAITHLNSRNYDLPPEVYAEGVELVCGFHDKLQEFEKKIANGPYVPFEHKVI